MSVMSVSSINQGFLPQDVILMYNIYLWTWVCVNTYKTWDFDIIIVCQFGLQLHVDVPTKEALLC